MARKKKTRVFVSYSRHDEALVKPLGALLGVATNDAIFLDVSSLKPGDSWEDEIIKAVKDSSVFVLCWCCECKKSEFITKEISTALADRHKRLVPVLFCSMDLPTDLASRQWIDLRGRIIHDCTETHEKKPPVGSGGAGSGGATMYGSKSDKANRRQWSERESAWRSERVYRDRSAEYERSSRLDYSYERHPSARPSIPTGPVAFRGSSYGCVRYVVALVAVGGLTWWGLHSHREFTWSVLRYLGYSLAVLTLSVLFYRLISGAAHSVIRKWRTKRMKQADDIANRARSYFEGLGKVPAK